MVGVTSAGPFISRGPPPARRPHRDPVPSINVQLCPCSRSGESSCPLSTAFVANFSRRSWGATSSQVGVGGHLHYGLGPIRRNLRQMAPTLLCGEHGTTKGCSCCFGPVQFARARRVVRGAIRLVNVRGAVECVTPRCPFYGRTINRDVASGKDLLSRLTSTDLRNVWVGWHQVVI
jgi:hypothetical protein